MRYVKKAKNRNEQENLKLTKTVTEIINRIRTDGDSALLEYNRMFDQSSRTKLRVSREEIEWAYSNVTPSEIEDIRLAASNIRSFAEAQMASITSIENFQTLDGVTLGHRIIPVSASCCYVPGGSYPLYSTALMLIIPAKVAGVKRIVTCSPCVGGTARVDSKTLVAMDIAGADEIYAMGGAQSIGAFAYGTDQIKAVDLIVGPGNQYVTEAKRQCYGQVGIDFVAGPSELLILADDTGNYELIAADLLAQSEHDELAKGILISTDEELAIKVLDEVESQLKGLPTAAKASLSWDQYGEIIHVPNLEDAIKLTNDYAPEHLEIMLKNNEEIIENLFNYGSLFIGQYSAEVFGDYASGTNHTLPTKKAARYTGGVWVGTFTKVCTHQTLSHDAMDAMVPLVSRLARGEGLEAHARAAEIRRKLT